MDKMGVGGCAGVGGGYVAPRPGCAFHGGKIPRYGDVFPGNTPRPGNTHRPAPGKFRPSRRAALFHPARPPPGQNKSPGRIPRGSDLGLCF